MQKTMNYLAGHRKRLRARYRLNGEAALKDYDLLELLLTFAIPRQDTVVAAHSRSGAV